MKYGLCIEMALTDIPFEQRFKAAADLGLEFIEMWFVKDFSFNGTPEELAKLASDAGVKITNTVIGAPDGSIGGGLTNPVNRSQWLDRAKMTIDFNKAAGIPMSIVCTGNTIDGMSEAQMTESVIEGLKPTVEMAEAAGITLLLEPLNTSYDHEGYFVDNSTKGAEICRALKSERMKLIYDCYHMQIMEGDLVKHIEKSLDVIGHFHSAGVPGRNELFKGETNYPFVIDQIEKMGYDGVFGLEYEPSMKKQKDSVKRVLERLP
ncbi:MAG: TIM barrel protein [Sedimentisphaerales bacterium]|nr:TIM barrel protein [Sedimentisphaerales bacterium]